MAEQEMRLSLSELDDRTLSSWLLLLAQQHARLLWIEDAAGHICGALLTALPAQRLAGEQYTVRPYWGKAGGDCQDDSSSLSEQLSAEDISFYDADV